MTRYLCVFSLVVILIVYIVFGESITNSPTTTPSTTASIQSDDDDGFIVDDEGNDEDGATERDLHHMKGLKGMNAMKLVKHKSIHSKHVMIKRPLIVQEPAVPQVTQRIEIREIIKEQSCPSGMDLVGDQCVGNEVCPPNYVCPPSTVMTNGECLAFSRPRIDCPDRFDLRDGRCVSSEVLPAQFTCRNPEETLDSTGMGCVSEIPQPPICPPGFRMTNGECIQVLPSSLQCPPGYTISVGSRQCVKTVTFPASIVCPDGSTLNPDTQKCVVIKQAPPRCPREFVFDNVSQSCVKRVPQVHGDCPVGFHSIANSCEKIDRYPAEHFCPPDYTMENGSCVKLIPVPSRCPDGYQQSSNNNMCETIVREIPICPEGTISIGSGAGLKCQSTNEHDIIQCCPSGFEIEQGRCRRIEQLVPVLSCEDECYKVRATKVAYMCPDDAQFVDHLATPKCIRRIPSQQCSSVDVDISSTASRCLTPKKNEAGELRALHGAMDVDCLPHPPAASPCIETLKEKAIIAQPYCPEGGEVNQDHCIVRDPIIPERICKVGTMDLVSGQCIRETFVPIKSECPSGTIRKGLQCLSFSNHVPQMVCPNGSETGPNGCCVAYIDAIFPPPRVIRTPPALRCSVGQLSANNECVEVERVPLEMVCPEGTMNMGAMEMVVEKRIGKDAPVLGVLHCIVTAELIVPPAVEKYVRPSYICPDGSRARGYDCHSTETVEPESICALDTILDGQGNCIRSIQLIVPPPRIVSSIAMPVCPPGTEMRGTRCIAIHEAEPLVSCPTDYEYDGHRCSHSRPPRPVCPIGMTPGPEGCIRQTFAAPMIRIIQGCSHEVIPTCTGCPRDVASTCHHI